MQPLRARLYTLFVALTGTMIIGSASLAMADEASGVAVANPIAEAVPGWDEYTGRFEAIEQAGIQPRVSGARSGLLRAIATSPQKHLARSCTKRT
jgi:hypothetical protein